MSKLVQAYDDILAGERTESYDLDGRIGFRYSGGSFVAPRVLVEYTCTGERVTGLTLRLPLQAIGLARMMGMLVRKGMAEETIRGWPQELPMAAVLTAQPQVLERWSADLLAAGSLPEFLRVGENALLDLDNYDLARCEVA